MKNKLLFFFLFASVFNYAQEDAWVYLTDKLNVTVSIANPITILTQDAIDRKTYQGIAIDERDVPVNEDYITQIKNTTGITVLAKSKWFNAVHVRGTEADINTLLTLTFVDYLEFANRSLNASRLNVNKNKFDLEDTLVNFTYGNTLNQTEMLNLDELHQLDYTGSGIVIAVLDAGFPNVNTIGGFQRLRDAGLLLDGYDFVNKTADVYAYTGNTHGTKVLSTMAGYVQDQYVGTAPDASYYLFRTEDAASENPVEESYWVEAAERADSLGVDIINTSLGYKTFDNPNYNYTSNDLDGNTTFITRGSNLAHEKGLLLITSSGNAGANGVNAPADSEHVFTIGAVDANGNYASFSSQGSATQPTQKPDVVARGSGSFVIDQNNNMIQNNGTSFSSPIIAGAMACLKQALPNLSNTELMQLVRESSSQYFAPDYFLGYGIPDFLSALNTALSLDDNLLDSFITFPNPIENDLQILFPKQVNSVQFFVVDILGKLIIETTVLKERHTINLEELNAGVYLGILNAANKKPYTFKIIKQ